jgi:hypothetical protein
MAHWRAVCGNWYLDVSYEALINDQENVSRGLIEFVGLEWQPECLDFHDNASPVATASAAQVRQPVYRDALQRWRRYESQLESLASALRAGGVDIDSAG